MIPHHTERPKNRRHAFTLIELLTVIAVVAVLAAILIPALQDVRERASTTKCIQNLRNWGTAIALYAQNNNNDVHWRDWSSTSKNYYNPYFGTDKVPSELKQEGVSAQEYFRMCPSQEYRGSGDLPAGYSFIRPSVRTGSGSYTPVDDPYKLTRVTNPAKLLWMIDGGAPLNITKPGELKSSILPYATGEGGKTVRHGGTLNALFADGHVESLTADDLDMNTDEEQQKVAAWFQL